MRRKNLIIFHLSLSEKRPYFNIIIYYWNEKKKKLSTEIFNINCYRVIDVLIIPMLYQVVFFFYKIEKMFCHIQIHDGFINIFLFNL